MEKSIDNVLSLDVIYRFKVKDPMSALTHFIGFWLSLIGMPMLLIRAAFYGAGTYELTGYAIFMVSMVLLYGASTSYHTFHISERADKVLKKIDHMMIFILIAGSYTPVCIVALRENHGLILMSVVWGIAIAGLVFKALWVTCPKWVSSVIYISMGWAAIFAIKPLYENMVPGAFALLLAGGILYTIGGVIYALKLRFLFKKPEVFGAHELFHVFVMLGSMCHYLMMFIYVTRM